MASSHTHTLRISSLTNSRTWYRLSDGAIENDSAVLAALEAQLAANDCSDTSLATVALEAFCATVDGANPQRVTPVPQIAADGSVLRTLYFSRAGLLVSGTVAETDPCDCPCPECVDPMPGLTVVKSATLNGLGVEGDTIDYQFVVTNTGNVDISDIEVDDPMVGPIAGSPIAGPLAVGDSVTLNATYTITAADVLANEVSNTATATGQTEDGPFGPVVSQNPSSPGPTVTPLLALSPSLSIVKSAVVNGTGVEGDTVTYSFEVTNDGNVDATNVVVSDPLVGAIAGSPIASLAAGASATLTATYTITAADVAANEISNTATASGDTPAGPVGPVDSESPDGPGPTIIDLTQPPSATLAKTATGSTGSLAAPAVGDVITYELSFTNIGGEPMVNVVFADAGATVIGSPVAGPVAPGASVTAVAQRTVTQADVDNGGVLNAATATAELPGGVPFGPIPSSPPGGLPGEPTEVPIAMIESATLTKTATPNFTGPAGTAQAGDTIDYLFEYTNTGNTTQNAPTVTDAMLGLTDQALTPASVAPGSVATFSTSYTVTAQDIIDGDVSNSATAQADGQDGPVGPVDSNPPGGLPGESTEVTIAMIESATLTKTATPNFAPPASVGDSINYQFEFTNTGNVTITAPTVSDPQIGVIDQPMSPVLVAPGASAFYSVTYIVTAGDLALGTLSNSAAVTGSGPNGPVGPFPSQPPGGNPGEPTDTLLVPPVSQAAIVVTKTVSDPSPSVGEFVAFTINVTNNGPDAATGAVLTDVLPVGLTHFNNSGGYNPVTGEINIGTLPAGSSEFYQIIAQVEAGAAGQTLTNTATFTANETNPNPANATDSVDVVVAASGFADIAINIGTNAGALNPLDQFNNFVTVQNIGTEAATSVVISVPTEAGFGFISATPSVGTFNPVTGQWTIPAMAAGATATLNVGYIVNAGTASGTTTFNASLTSLTGTDNNASNNLASIAVVVQQPAQPVDLQINKSASPTNPAVGDQVTFTVNVLNTGTTAANDTLITDVLPTGLTFVSASDPFYDSFSGTVGPLTVPAGGQTTLTIVATVDAGTEGQTITNSASVFSPDDTDPFNNSTSADITVAGTPPPSDLLVVKTLDQGFSFPSGPAGEFVEGDQLTYTLQVTNNGLGAASNVVVQDPSRPGGNWVIGNLAPGQTLQDSQYSYTLTAADITAGEYVNVAEASGNDADGPIDTAAFVNVPVGPGTEGQPATGGSGQIASPTGFLWRTSPAPIVAGVPFEIDGGIGAGATNAVMQFTFPPQFTLTSFTSTHGTYDPSTQQLTIPDTGASLTGVTYIIEGTVPAGLGIVLMQWKADLISQDQINPYGALRDLIVEFSVNT